MTKKVSKKDKLNAMLQMWTILREAYNSKRPWRNESNEYKIMSALDIELAAILDIKLDSEKALLSKDQITLLVERLKQVQGELRTLKTDANARYGGSEKLDALIGWLEDKLKSAVPVPVNFAVKKHEIATSPKDGELPSPESA